MAQDAVVSAQSSRDVVALRSAVMRASRLGIDQDTMDMAKHNLQEMLQIAMRNNVTGHLQKCIDVAQARGADSELIKQAQAMMDKSLAERNLYAVISRSASYGELRAWENRGNLTRIVMAESSDAYSFGQAAAPAAGSQSNTSQSIDTGGSEASELRRPSIPVRAFVEPRGRSAAMVAIEDNPSEPRSGSRRPPVTTVSPPSTPRKKSKPSDPPSPIPVVTPSGPGSFQKVSMPSTGSDNYSLYRDEISEYRTMMEKVEEENNDLRLRIGEIYSYANQQFVQLESATQSEMQSMAQQLQLLNAELTAAKQEDEGATYRIEELERYKLMSDETSSYLQHQYAALRSQFDEQMDRATTIVAQTGHGLRDQVDRLRHALENAEITARQESMAVSQDRHFEDVDGYVERVANHIEVLQEYSPTPIFVNLLSDANFLGSKAAIAPVMNELATRLRSVGILQSSNDKFWRGMYACGGDPHFWKRGEKKEIIWAYMEKMLFRQKMMLLCGLDDSLMNSINEECIHQTNSRLELQLIQDCTDWPSVIPRDTESSTQKNSNSSKVLGSMIDLKRLNKRTRWNDVRRGIFRPEPNYDPEEFWLEVHHLSDFICEACSAAIENPNVWNTNTESYRSCLNCSANWNRMNSHENHEPFFNEHEVDANVAARLINVYNTSWDWREVTATQDLKAFMVTAAMSMVSAYQTSGDVLKQVSHRGAIRLPVKMIKGKCKRNLLGQFAVQRESIVDVDEKNATTTRWFYRLTWDGGNVAYHDYVKTVLSNEEFYNIFGSHPSAEYVGDIMEFWLGMFELAIQFPMLFNGWGKDPAACLSGIEESFWMFTNSCRQATTDNSKRSRSKKAIVPTVEVQVVNRVLNDAGVYGLLATHSITRMPIPPQKRDELPIEISSDEEEETGDFMPTAEEAPTEPFDDDDEMEDEDKPFEEGDADMGGDDEGQDDDEPQNEAKRRRKGIRGLFEQFEGLLEGAGTTNFCFVCGGAHQIEECQEPGKGQMAIALNLIKTNLENGSKSPPSRSERTTKSSRGRKDKLPKSSFPRKRRWTRPAQMTTEEVETCEYSVPTYMNEIGDRADGGEYLVNDVDISRGGPKDKWEMELLIERASSEAPPIVSSVRDYVEGRVGYRQPADSDEAKHKYANFRLYTNGIVIGRLELMNIKGAEYAGKGWSQVPVFTNEDWVPKSKEQIPAWYAQQSKRFNAILRHAVGIKIDSRGKDGLACDEGAWVDVDTFMRHDPAWVDFKRHKHGQLQWDEVIERWNNFRKTIYYEFKAQNRIRAQVLALVATRGELRKVYQSDGEKEKVFCKALDLNKLRLEEDNPYSRDDDDIYLWPAAVRAPMSHSKRPEGVRIDEWRVSYKINPGVAQILSGGYHRTKLDVFGQRIIPEGLRPGGDGDRGSTFFVPFAPWDQRSQRGPLKVVEFKSIPPPSVYIYVTSARLMEYGARLSADGHILVQREIPFSAFDAVWYEETRGVFRRLLIKNGEAQLVLSVDDAKTVARIEKFEKILEETIQQSKGEASETVDKLVEIQDFHTKKTPLFPGHAKWNEAVSLIALIYKPRRASHRLCPACLSETHDMMSLCFVCSGKFISHGWRKKKTIPTGGEYSPDDDPDQDDVRDHVKETWEHVKEEEDLDDEETLNEEEEIDVEEDMDEKMEGANAKGATSGVRDARDYPAWMNRIKFSSKVLPQEPCIIGDAQTELIHIVILMIANNLGTFLARYHSLFCEDVGKLASAHADKSEERIDIDPKIPFLGVDNAGELIEPTDEQLEDYYRTSMNKKSKFDQGPDGYVRSYHGSLVFKRLATYILECGYTAEEFKAHFAVPDIDRRKMKRETATEEEAAHELAVANLQEQSRFMRRFIAGAYGATAVYFFRNQRFINTIYLNPVDLICACRYDHRRLAVIHMCMQNGLVVPRAHQQRLFDAIEEWNREKNRDTQRPQWATHSTPAHILAIVDTPVPAQFHREPSGARAAEAKSAATPSSSSSATRVTQSTVRPPAPPPPSRALGAEPKSAPAKGGKKGKGKPTTTEYHAEHQDQAPWRREDRGWGGGGGRSDWSAGGHRDWHGGNRR
eukprot:s370_g32.t1